MTSSFQTELKLQWIDGRTFALLEGFNYWTDVEGAPAIVMVPAGFVTDFASIPRGLWNLFPPTGQYGKAAVIHDFLYRNTDLDRAICDRVFLEAMEVLKVGWLTRRTIFAAVRVFGRFARKKMK